MIANDVFDLAARQASWLLARQRVVAQNVANANTPGYKTADLEAVRGHLAVGFVAACCDFSRPFRPR